jgi:uncharacterized membrane protein YkoI
MRARTKWIVTGATVVVLLGTASAVTASTRGDDDEAPITGAALRQASEAALAHVGEGRVTETEIGDEDSYYEVEVTRPDGTQVDVQLDERFRVVDASADRDEPGDDRDD